MKRSACCLALALSACAGQQLQPPSQPTPASINAAIADLSQITASPMQVWEAGDFAIRTACDAYLNQAAARSADLGLASGSVSLAGTAATGILAAGGMFPAGALAGGLTALAQSYLALYQSSGALPYTTETTTIIGNAMAAYEGAIMLPLDVAQAMLDVEGLWALCSPSGYSQLVAKAVATANISAVPGANLGRASFVASAPASRGRPVIMVNGH